jgi:hypothetical protein
MEDNKFDNILDNEHPWSFKDIGSNSISSMLFEQSHSLFSKIPSRMVTENTYQIRMLYLKSKRNFPVASILANLTPT